MNAAIARVIGTGTFFILIFISGFWLSHLGKPYRAVPFTLHKFIALGALVFLGFIVNKIHQAAPFTAAQVTAIAVTGILFAITIVSGGLSSVDKALPALVSWLHHISPFLTLISTGVTLLLLFRSG